MKLKRFFTFLFCYSLSSMSIATSNVCLSLTNYGQNAVTLRAAAGPGFPTIAEPLQTVTLPPDEMDWACPNENRCQIEIRDNASGDVTFINHLKNGARIIYAAKNRYEVDPDRNDACQIAL